MEERSGHVDGGEPGEELRWVAGRRTESGVSGKPAQGTLLEKSSWSTGLLATESPCEMRQKVATGFGHVEAAQGSCKSSFGGAMGRESLVAVARGHGEQER